MKAVVAAFNQEKALVGAFSVITNLRMELFEALQQARQQRGGRGRAGDRGPRARPRQPRGPRFRVRADEAPEEIQTRVHRQDQVHGQAHGACCAVYTTNIADIQYF